MSAYERDLDLRSLYVSIGIVEVATINTLASSLTSITNLGVHTLVAADVDATVASVGSLGVRGNATLANTSTLWTGAARVDSLTVAHLATFGTDATCYTNDVYGNALSVTVASFSTLFAVNAVLSTVNATTIYESMEFNTVSSVNTLSIVNYGSMGSDVTFDMASINVDFANIERASIFDAHIVNDHTMSVDSTLYTGELHVADMQTMAPDATLYTHHARIVGANIGLATVSSLIVDNNATFSADSTLWTGQASVSVLQAGVATVATLHGLDNATFSADSTLWTGRVLATTLTASALLGAVDVTLGSALVNGSLMYFRYAIQLNSNPPLPPP